MSLTNQIFESGIIGCGGAGFPTHAKLSSGVKHLLLNGAECEPLLRTDRYIMCHEADKVIKAASAVRKELGNIACTIALKATYKEEIAALKKSIEKIDSKIEIYEMKSFYPAGDEQVIVAEITGCAVPPAGIPLDVGCVVSNVATMVCIADAMDNKPFTDKYLTVTGLVKKPTVMKVPVGTSFEECISLAGGAITPNYIVVSGGPMMGQRITKEMALSSFVTKTTSGILLLPDEGYIGSSEQISIKHMKNRARSACIQCSYCTQMCPRNLLGHPLEPHRIMRKMALSNDTESLLDDTDIRRAALCCECGICEIYACPMQLQPRRINALIKGELNKAGIRYPKGEGALQISPIRDSRLIPTKRAAARAGVLEFYSSCSTNTLETYIPNNVSLNLHMNIGAPAEPVVKQGDFVAVGQLIAKCPDGKLGANLHASIGGKVSIFTDSITITNGEAK